MQGRVRVSLVVCALNEEGNVGATLRRVPAIVDEILLVDGRSVDGTVAEALAADERVRVLTQQGTGKGDALRMGFENARGDILVMIDADASMDPEEIPRFVETIEAGADVAKGSRAAPGGSEDFTAIRGLGNASLCMIANALHGARFTDLCYGFMAFRREALEGIDIRSRGFEVEAELTLKLYRARRRIVEVPSFERRRLNGHSHLDALRDGWAILRRIVQLRQVTVPAR